MWAFFTSKDNSNVSLLHGLLWLQNVDVKLFIWNKKIYIRDTKKGEAVFQISCSTTPSEDTRFQANSKSKVDIDKSPEKKNIENRDGDSIEVESDNESFNQSF